MVAICSYKLILYVFFLVVDENKIVYEWIQLARKLHSRSEGTPKEEGDSCLYFLCHTTDNEPLMFVLAATINMAQKSLHEFSVLAVANVPTRPAVNLRDKSFELQTGLITMV
jgi:hypothetical protein